MSVLHVRFAHATRCPLRGNMSQNFATAGGYVLTREGDDVVVTHPQGKGITRVPWAQVTEWCETPAPPSPPPPAPAPVAKARSRSQARRLVETEVAVDEAVASFAEEAAQ